VCVRVCLRARVCVCACVCSFVRGSVVDLLCLAGFGNPRGGDDRHAGAGRRLPPVPL
jgi:hypothetical protein